MKTPPTLEQFKAYQGAWSYFNKTLFDGKLKPCLLNFRGRHKLNLGIFWPQRWVKTDGTATHEISLNPDVLSQPLAETMATLVHEMCHQWQQDHGEPPRGNYHDKEWGAKMEVIGLIPSNTGLPGGKKTGQQMHHYAEKGGAFAKALDKMPKDVKLPWLAAAIPEKEKKPTKNKNKIKYICPDCEACIWGKSGLAVACVGCGWEFVEQEQE